MTEGVQPDVATPDAPEPDPGLPLLKLDRGIAPIRRVVAFAVENPEGVSYFEVNARRWLEPLLVLEVPESIRELLVTLTGQISGIDSLDAAAKLARLQRIRQLVTRLDAILGLPLPRADYRPPRPPKKPRPPKPERSEAPKEGRNRRDRRRGKGEREAAESAPAPAEAPRKRSFWSGNPYVGIDELDVEAPLAEALAAAGIRTVRDLLTRPPATVEQYRPIHGAGRELPEGRIAVGGRLKSTWTLCRPDGSQKMFAKLHGAGPVTLVWERAEDARWWLDGVSRDERVVVVGTWNGEQIVEPEVVFDSGKSVSLPRFGVDGVPDARIQALLFRLMPSIKQLRDPIANAFRSGHVSLPEAIEALHGRGDAAAARKRLAFDEAVIVALAAGWARYGGGKVRGIQHALVHTRLDRLLWSADVRLSDAQQLGFDAIKRDLRRSRPMRRVLTGGPGGGKGLIALLTAVLVAEGKCQVLWLSSDAQSAESRFTFCEALLRDAGMVGRLATGKPNGAMRDAVKRGEIHVLFATPEILDAELEFRRLGLVISSESENCGAVSKKVEDIRSPRPDLLVVPTTPPSLGTLLSAWPDHEVTRVEGGPVPEVVVKSAANRVSAYAPARHAIMGGGQVAVLFPQLNGTDALDPSEAHRVVAALGSEALSDARIALLHGAMPRDERQRVVKDFSHRRADALVATAPLEDAAPVPGLQLAVVEHAHRIDPVRLRRIAGMNIRNVTLVVEEGTDEARGAELARLVKTASEAPFDPDESLPGFRFLDPENDADLLLDGRNAAFGILALDPGLRSGQSADLVRAARASWDHLVGPEVECALPEPSEGGGKRRRRRRRRK